ncbi:hypothetical protein AMATHDRAFT_9293 [Amanita thiersii Skay4041]|uniref:Uncharacterized protein n=1 Tax=Amanita thiersii Skay4041 TaxID=703135 RepID=A0A2A9N7H2_9AGAR|nr:hypothetical protein AMATHDRAFT_9293 [Amanita thiersii Skay4041]
MPLFGSSWLPISLGRLSSVTTTRRRWSALCGDTIDTLPPLHTLIRKPNAIKLIIEFLIANLRAFTFENLVIPEDEDQGATTSQPASPPKT